jgi:hypothetical protein
LPPPPPTAVVNKWQDGGAGTIGLIHLRKLLRAAVQEKGLYIAFPKLISFRHPPLLLPWSELHLVSDKVFLGIRVVTLHVGDPKIARAVLRDGVAARVAERLMSR